MKDLIKLADGKIKNKDTRKHVHNDMNIRKNRWQKKSHMKKFVKFMVHYLITQIIPIKKSLLESWQQVQGEESSYTQFIFSSTVKDFVIEWMDPGIIWKQNLDVITTPRARIGTKLAANIFKARKTIHKRACMKSTRYYSTSKEHWS